MSDDDDVNDACDGGRRKRERERERERESGGGGWGVRVIIKMVNILQVRLQFVGKSILFLSTTNQPRHAEECRTV